MYPEDHGKLDVDPIPESDPTDKTPTAGLKSKQVLNTLNNVYAV